MISKDTQKSQFARHYKQLEINDQANWEIARSSYRRLVHIWHPDRFTSRPRERAHAQQRFIDLTKSYNALRDFYKQNHRLPFQSIHVTRKKSVPAQETDGPGEAQASDARVMNANVLGRDLRQRDNSQRKRKKVRKIAWPLTVALTMVATVAFFLFLDRKENQATAEIGREVVKDSPKSEFAPNNSEIRRSQTRGAFVKPTK